jgi:hypothetical protein
VESQGSVGKKPEVKAELFAPCAAPQRKSRRLLEFSEDTCMTFIVNQQGRVHQKDLRPKTVKLAAGMKMQGPDKTWTVSPDWA